MCVCVCVVVRNAVCVCVCVCVNGCFENLSDTKKKTEHKDK